MSLSLIPWPDLLDHYKHPPDVQVSSPIDIKRLDR